MDHLTRHLIADYYGCQADFLDDPERIHEVLVEAARRAKTTLVDVLLHHFAPYGVSGVAILGESHLAIHTWPEHGFVAIEIFVCSDWAVPEEGHRYLAEQFRASEAEVRMLERGERSRLPRDLRLPPRDVGGG